MAINNNYYVTQLAMNEILTVEEGYMVFDSMSETQYNYLTANVGWSVTSKPFWVTVTPTSGSGSYNLTISVAENFGSQRTGDVVITGVTKTVTISITQYAAV